MISSTDKKYFKLAIGFNNIGKETEVDISARCPICGDSRKNKNSKRLHLYHKAGETRINCFNGDCEVNNKTMFSFLKNFFPNLFEQYKRATFNSNLINLNKTESNNIDVFSSFAKEKIEHKIEDKTNIIYHDLEEYMTNIEDVPEAIEYIKNRGFDYSILKSKVGNWYYGHQNLLIGDITYNIANSIIVPLYHNNRMYGFYSRNTSNKYFCTYMNEHNIGYKIWNWFNIDKSKPVYIFEGIFDALSSGYDNVIAAIGAKIPDDRIKELKDPIFCYDNDKTGLTNALQQANKGFKVYVQPHGYSKDMNENLLNGVDCKKLIKENIYTDIMASVQIKSKL